MTTPGWTPEDAEALRRLQERQQAAAQPVTPAADPALGNVPAADEAELEPEPDPGQPDELPADETAAEPAGAASFPGQVSGAGDGSGDVVPDAESAADEASGPAAADDEGFPLVGEPGAGPADQGPAEAVDLDAGNELDPRPDAEPVMTAAEAQQAHSAAGAAALPDFMQVSQAVPGAGEPALPDSATGN